MEPFAILKLIISNRNRGENKTNEEKIEKRDAQFGCTPLCFLDLINSGYQIHGWTSSHFLEGRQVLLV